MNFKFIKINFLTFISTYIFISLFLSVFIYKLLIRDYVELESQQNIKNINSILKQIDTRITNIKSIVNDYSKWDDTYNFIENKDQSYLYENFREGTSTLEDLNIDFIIFSDSKHNILFSKFLENKSISINDLELNIVNKLKNKNKASTIFKNEDKLIYLIKENILKSDFSGNSNGYIIGGKFINDSSLTSLSNVFESLEFSTSHYYKNTDLEYQLLNNNLVTVRHTYHNDYVLNFIQFFDLNNNYTFTINAKNTQAILKKGEETLLILILAVSLILFILLFLLYRNQKIVQRYNSMLEDKVNRRTKQLQKSLKSLKEKNKELNRISNTDSLTAIRNRRSFFAEGKKALDDAIKNDKDLNILLMDIDHFKKINDTYGHAAGDAVLKEFSRLVESIIDENTIFGRLGGEEFSIVFKDTYFGKVAKISEQIRKEIEENTLKFADNEIKFTVSLGLANKRDSKFIDEMLVMADEFLYKAKNNGRNKLIRENIRQKKRVL